MNIFTRAKEWWINKVMMEGEDEVTAGVTTDLCVHNVIAGVGGYSDGDHIHCLDCNTDLTTGEKLT